jgi:hypothetical protein
VVGVRKPEEKTGSGLRTLTVIEANVAELVASDARIVTVWPAAKVAAGEKRPEEVMNPVDAAPPPAPFTAQLKAAEDEPAKTAVYCALPPSLTEDGPVTVTVCASMRPLKPEIASKAIAHRGRAAMTRP